MPRCGFDPFLAEAADEQSMTLGAVEAHSVSRNEGVVKQPHCASPIPLTAPKRSQLSTAVNDLDSYTCLTLTTDL